MAIDTTIPRSRRGLLGAAAGGLAALVASALGRPLPARGFDGETVTVGGSFDGSQVTQVTNLSLSGIEDGLRGTTWSSSGRGVVGSATAASGIAYGVHGSSASASGRGVYGEATSTVDAVSCGVYGTAASPSGFGVYGKATAASVDATGVYGMSDHGTGVYGFSTSGSGVRAVSNSAIGCRVWSNSVEDPATFSHAYGGTTAVFGFSGAGSVPATPARTGVYGYAAQNTSARGVWGETISGRGVNGQATSGRGVHGYASSGVGVYAACGASGRALHAQGRVTFSTAGHATIAAGTKSVQVDPGIDLTTDSKILCTLEGSPGGTTTVQRVGKSTTTDLFTIYLTANAASAVQVAWFIIG